MKKIICLLLIFILLGCSQGNSSMEKLEKIDNYYEVIKQEFGKEVMIQFPVDILEVYTNDKKDFVEYRVGYSAENTYCILRIKKADAFEDITSDLKINWDTQNQDTKGTLHGIHGEGTIQLNYLDNPKNTFKGEIWFDNIDHMAYAILAIGEDTPSQDVKTIFSPGYSINIDIHSYDEAVQFLENHTSDNFFYREEENGTSQIYIEDEAIHVFNGNDDNYTKTVYYPNGKYTTWTRTTDISTGNFIETIDDTYQENSYSSSEWTKDLICISSYGENRDTGYKNLIKYDLNGMETYNYYEDQNKVDEIIYSGNGGSKTSKNKNNGNVVSSTFKRLIVDGAVRNYYLTVDNSSLTKIYTYASDDSTNLVRYEATDKKTGEHVVWTFNGKGNNFENMISCVRTYNGSTSTYTFNTVPWGTGMLYPPENPGDFYF